MNEQDQTYTVNWEDYQALQSLKRWRDNIEKLDSKTLSYNEKQRVRDKQVVELKRMKDLAYNANHAEPLKIIEISMNVKTDDAYDALRYFDGRSLETQAYGLKYGKSFIAACISSVYLQRTLDEYIGDLRNRTRNARLANMLDRVYPD